MDRRGEVRRKRIRREGSKRRRIRKRIRMEG